MTNPRTAARAAFRWLCAAALGIALAWSLLAHFGVRMPFGPLMWGLGAVVSAGLSLGAHAILFRVIGPRLAVLPGHGMRILLIGGALAGGVLLISLLPIRVRHLHTLEITATGQQNPAARSNEVWLIALTLPDQSRVSFGDMDHDSSWKPGHGMLHTHETLPATLRWRAAVPIGFLFHSDGTRAWNAAASLPDATDDGQNWSQKRGTMHVRFFSHPHSGVVHVTWDGQEHTLDLYSDERTEQRLELPVTARDIAYDRALMIVGLIIDTLLISIALLVAAVAVNERTDWTTVRAKRGQLLAAAGTMILISGLVVGELWRRGLCNFAYGEGQLEIEAAVEGPDYLPLHLDADGREVVDISLDLYEHNVHCERVSDGRENRVGLRGVVNDESQLHPHRRLQLDGRGPIEKLTTTKHPSWSVMWMAANQLRAFSWRRTYENAAAHFYLPDGPARVVLTIDGHTEEIELQPNEDGWVYVSLRPQVRPPGLIRYTVTLPAVRITQLRAVPLPGTTSCTIGEMQLRIPRLQAVKSSSSDRQPSSTNGPPALNLTGPLKYSAAVPLGHVRVFVLCVTIGMLGLWSVWRLRGTTARGPLRTSPVALWEYAIPLGGALLGLWLQSGLCGAFAGDSMGYVSQAITLIETGTLDPVLNAHPPGVYLLLAAIMLCGGKGAAIWATISVLLVIAIGAAWYAGRLLAGRVGGVWMTIFVAANPLLLIASRVLLADFLLAVACLVWFVVVLRWAMARSKISWIWAVVTALLWAVPLSLKPNAVTLAAIGLLVPFLQRGSWKPRIAAATCFLIVALGVYSIPGIHGGATGMAGWGRFWPVLKNHFVAMESGEFRPLREDFLASKLSAPTVSRQPRLFYDRIYTEARSEETEAAIAATTAASIRRRPGHVWNTLKRCLHRAYIKPSTEQLYGFPNHYRTAEVYNSICEQVFIPRLRTDRRYHPETADFFATLQTPHPEGTLAWKIFPQWHKFSWSWRLGPMTVLAIIGVGYAVYRRRGLLVLPAAMNLLIVLPLCAIFASYDRYFLPAEALLALQAAVGVRALLGIVWRRTHWA